MLCKDLKVVNLNITEDYYEYKGLFRLCSGEKCLDIDLMDLDNDNKLKEIKSNFNLKDDISDIKTILMEKIMEATKIESRIVEGKDYNENENDKKTERKISSMDMA
ncbi:MAG: hypothetical protein PWR27_341 [Petroclostridium sp.]|uniref:hypothetical protein n=1 Tax=Petroclostridium xylanilyticum TaxID=1792311 RepID=UPI000B98F7A8|nr:hypothetical protein [Petroclostridium xylanilyticum]MBZ4646381.1 hypothetical protein [Clostridia bacterium]MDK2809632.1 hypothetical protein [Petroclostridium sp.]